MSVADRLNKLTTDITNAYTSIENKGGTIPSDKNTDNLHTAIDSIEVIEQATTEGESLSLTNTKAMPYSDYVVKGKSEQTTRSGKNLLQNTATSQTISGVTFTVNEDGSVTCNGTATNNIFFYLTGNNSIENIILNGCPAGGSGDSYLVRAIDTNGRVLKTDFGEGTEVFNLINAKIQIRIAKDYICNNLTFYPMIRLATIEDDTYEPYGASPSPDYPSEIHSVADDVNLFDASKIANSSIVVSDNGKTIIMPLFTSAGGYTSTNKKLSELCPELKAGEVAYLHFIKNIIGIYNNYIYLVGSNRAWQKDSYATITEDDLNSTVILYGNDYSHGETEQLIITDFKIQKGTVTTPYSPYNQGTVTIKQRGKNLWNEELENAEYDNNGNKQDATIWLVNKNKINVNPNTTYTISQQQTPSQYRIICFNNNTFLEWISSVQDITTGYKNFTFTTPVNCNKVYIQFRSIIEKIAQGNYNMIPSDITNIQLEQGSTATDYEPYQTPHDYTIQTEPLRSLPNGVKDTIEEDGIHRRVGRIVLYGTDNWSFATEGDNTNGKTFYSNRKSDMKSLTYQEVISLDDIFVISDTFKGYAFKELNKTPRKLNFISLGINTLLINISNETGVKTVEEFKTYLNNNPIVVQYQLNEEVIEPLTQNQATTMLDIIKTGSYEGTTNIYTDEDVKPTIGVGYYKKD